MNESFHVVLARLEALQLDMSRVNFASLQGKTYDRYRRELADVKEDLRKAINSANKPERPKKDAGTPLRAEAK